MQPRLRGRRRECDVLDAVLASVRTGESRVLVLRGEAGIGKTALLEHLAGNASGFRVARAAGVESEMELAHAGLHQLCAPFAARIEGLPGPQRDALDTAFGRRGGDPPNRFLVGVAVLGLLSDVAEEMPLLWMLGAAAALAIGWARPAPWLLATLLNLILIAIWSFAFVRTLRTTPTAPEPVRRARRPRARVRAIDVRHRAENFSHATDAIHRVGS